MGKRYYCDYCDKTMVAAPTIVKTHNKGLLHQRLVHEHYQQYKDAKTILAEESKKKPCIRFLRGECSFGGICRFSHYTREEITALKDYGRHIITLHNREGREQITVALKNLGNTDMSQPSFEYLYQKLQNEKSTQPDDVFKDNTVMYDSNGVTHVFPWTYNNALDEYGENLPPSIKRLKIEDLENAKIVTWG